MSTPVPLFLFTTLEGGSGGTEFSDLVNDPDIRYCRLTKVDYWTHLDALVGIRLVWVNKRGEAVRSKVHGSTFGELGSFYLGNGERIIALNGHASTLIDALTLITNKGRSVQFGQTSSPFFEWTVDLKKYPNAAFHYFTGRSGTFIDALQAVFITEAKIMGP